MKTLRAITLWYGENDEDEFWESREIDVPQKEDKTWL